MSDPVLRLGDAAVLVYPADGPPLPGPDSATDLVSRAFEHGATWIAVPAERLDPDFFRLETRVAGELVQKLVNYGLALAVVGDVSAHVARSKAFADFVREANRGRQLWFVPGLDALAQMLGGDAPA